MLYDIQAPPDLGAGHMPTNTCSRRLGKDTFPPCSCLAMAATDSAAIPSYDKQGLAANAIAEL